jgi:hypothetical protein
VLAASGGAPTTSHRASSAVSLKICRSTSGSTYTADSEASVCDSPAMRMRPNAGEDHVELGLVKVTVPRGALSNGQAPQSGAEYRDVELRGEVGVPHAELVRRAPEGLIGVQHSGHGGNLQGMRSPRT